MDIDDILSKIDEKLRSKVSSVYNKLIGEGKRPDVAIVRAFNRVVAGKDSVDWNIDSILKQLKSNRFHVDYLHSDKITLNPNDLEQKDGFYLAPLSLTVSGVNLNLQYKSSAEIKKTVDRQGGWVIPSVNDHPEELLFNEETNDYEWRVEPKDFEISGFVTDLEIIDMPDDELGITGVDHIPVEFPELLDNWGVSIGYLADQDYTGGSYKDSEYWISQSNITIVHNARMITQRPSIPPEHPKGQSIGAGYGVINKKDTKLDITVTHNNKVSNISIDDDIGGTGMNDKEIEAMKTELDELRAKVKANDDSKLDKKLADAVAKSTDLQTQIDTIQAESDKKDATIKGLEDQVKELAPFKAEIDAKVAEQKQKVVDEFKSLFVKDGKPMYDDDWVGKRDVEVLQVMIDTVKGQKDFKPAPKGSKGTDGYKPKCNWDVK